MLKIRLRREGSRNHPFYRMVVSDSRRAPTGPTLEVLGYYNPQSNPPLVHIDLPRYEEWVGKRGAPFGFGEEPRFGPAQEDAEEPRPVNDDARMQAFLTQVVRALVEHPDQATVSVLDGRRATRLEIRTGDDDRGQVIGKNGATIRSIRTLAAISAHRRRRRFEVELPG